MNKKDDLYAKIIPELMKSCSREGEVTAALKKSIAKKLSASLVEIEQVATFYPSLSIPPAKYQVVVCKSLSCHMEGSDDIYMAIKKKLEINKDGVSGDGEYSLTWVNCFGRCAVGPNMTINDKAFSGLTVEKAISVLPKRK